MPAMTAEVSRALAAFIASLGLGREAARALADQYASTTSVHDLPDWLTERDDGNQQLEAARADNNLKHWWLHGEGAGKWNTWTELYGHLKDHMADERAKRVAAEWFHERYGYWPGADKNRVAHGKPPRGEKVGPG